MHNANAANSAEYSAFRKQRDAIFSPANFTDEICSQLNSHYKLVTQRYWKILDDMVPVNVSENHLIDKDGHERYSYKNLFSAGDFASILVHSDETKYLIFRCDQFGYSVLNLTTFQDYHFYPQGALYREPLFMWTDVHYNNRNNILAASGYFWAAPSDVMLMDFTHPMDDPGKQIVLREIIDPDYRKYCDINFMGWSKTDILLELEDYEGNGMLKAGIREFEYRKWLAG